MVGRNNTNGIDIVPRHQISVVAESCATFVSSAGALLGIMCFDSFLSVTDPVGIEVTDGDDLYFLESQELAHIA